MSRVYNSLETKCLVDASLFFQESGFDCSSGLLENVLMFKFCLLLSCYGKLSACFEGISDIRIVLSIC